MKRLGLISLLIIAVILAGVTNALACETCGCMLAADDDHAEAHKEGVAAMPMGHPVSLPEGMNVKLVELEEMPVAYLEGTLFGDMDALFGKLQAMAEEQGLMTEKTLWGSAYPDDMSQGVDETTRVFVGISIDPQAEVAEPLLRGSIPAGTYMMAEHRGAYAGLESTYFALYTWAAENGVVFAIPSFEHYVNDPGVTPVEDLLTEVCFAFDHDAMKKAYMTGDDDDDGHHHKHGDHGH